MLTNLLPHLLVRHRTSPLNRSPSRRYHAAVSSAFDLFLVRHGATDWNENGRLLGRVGIGLNARGRAEAEAMAQAVSAFPLRAVAASPQRRTQETAESIAQPHRLPIRTEPGLDEVWVKESWLGRKWEELQDEPDLQHYMQDPSYRCDAFEPAAEVQARVIATAERLRAEGDGPVLLISHGDPIKLLLAHYLSMELASYRRIAVNTASLSVLRFYPRFGSRLLVLNWKPPGAIRQFLD